MICEFKIPEKTNVSKICFFIKWKENDVANRYKELKYNVRR